MNRRVSDILTLGQQLAVHTRTDAPPTIGAYVGLDQLGTTDVIVLNARAETFQPWEAGDTLVIPLDSVTLIRPVPAAPGDPEPVRHPAL